MVSVRKIAEKAGVSPATVSRVLNSQDSVDPELREAVLKIANEFRYFASGGKKDYMNLALVYLGKVSASGLLSSPFDFGLLQGMANKMSELQFTLSILDAQDALMPGESYSQMFHRRGIRGAALRSLTGSREACLAIAKEGFPSIVVAERFENSEVSWIDGNSTHASFMGVSKLIELGHKRIAFSSFDNSDQDHADRYHAYLSAHEKAGLTVDPAFEFKLPPERESGGVLLRQLMAMEPRPTAIFITDPFVAQGLLGEARRKGVDVPRDLSVLGLDDNKIRFETFPMMTSICQDTLQMGGRIAESLVSMIQSNDRQIYRIETPTWLELHESIGPPPE